MNIGEPIVPSLEFVSELSVVDTELMQYRGMQIMHVYRLVDNVVTEIVCGPIGEARFYSTTR